MLLWTNFCREIKQQKENKGNYSFRGKGTALPDTLVFKLITVAYRKYVIIKSMANEEQLLSTSHSHIV